MTNECADTADHIFDAVGVSPRPSAQSAVVGLEVGPRFKCKSVEGNPYLLYALMGLLSRAPIDSRGAQLRQSIQWLNLECPAIPELQGFTGLMELKLSIRHPSDSREDPSAYVFSERIAPFPSLEKLELDTDRSSHLESLDWLPAPQLKELKASGVGLRSIQGLAEIDTLESVDLSHNKNLVDLSPLSRSASSLRDLNLAACTAIDSFDAIKELTKIEKLQINGCTGVASLESLSHLTIGKDWELNRLELRKLAPLPVLAGDCLTLVNLHHIGSLEGLEQASELKTLTIDSLPALEDVSALIRMRHLKKLSISSCGNLSSLQCLELLPELTDVQILKCGNLKQLPSTWPAKLHSLTIGRCGITEIGRLPDNYSGDLNLTECNDLMSLRGLESCIGLTSVTTGPQLTDFSAVSGLTNTWLCIDFKNIQKNSARKNAKKDSLRLSDELVDALAALPMCRLKILHLNQPVPLHRLKAADLAPLARIPHLRALDISELQFSDLKNEITSLGSILLGMEELEVLRVAPRTALSRALGGCTFETATKLATLKLSLLGMG